MVGSKPISYFGHSLVVLFIIRNRLRDRQIIFSPISIHHDPYNRTLLTPPYQILLTASLIRYIHLWRTGLISSALSTLSQQRNEDTSLGSGKTQQDYYFWMRNMPTRRSMKCLIRLSFEHQLLDKNPQRKIRSRLSFYLLHKYFLNVREYSDKLKRCEDQLQFQETWSTMFDFDSSSNRQCFTIGGFTFQLEPTNDYAQDSPSKLSSPGITTWAKSLKLPQHLGGTQDESSSSENTPTMIMCMDVSSSGKLPSPG
ncbi:unnamed protein product [Lactuca saligna]|uniref:Uncharacterized protein n=1 Tax=Lactuca saligna TaxID=75948 RepID=A0AA35V272_LACSI|nr:unnamed protein product [Lactuca saligna]